MCSSDLDKPLVVQYDGGLYFPAFQFYPETTFGGFFETEADYRDPYVLELVQGSGGWMLWPPVRFDYSTVNYNLPGAAPSPPSGDNWLGTDDQARDVVARVVYGIRLNVLFGFSVIFFTTIVGIGLGLFASRRAVRPLANAAQAARAIADGRLDTRLEPTDDPDLQALTMAFNEMVATLQSRAERDARFTSDVSHELRDRKSTRLNSSH